ncbi:Transmembrane protein 252 [Oryzias melastigma]|uniref:Transmembrane protein 252 n=1 Tax=Oryzias melastigma TaxID=30732 RepID=A0A834L065_ORYME|nr:transmembrane protein 252 [Oryzias melastigma]KAF6737066.1 Transmembrane protein 252 [Oryzias melastigma]
MKKQLWSLACMLLPFAGFLLTCLGAYLLSMQSVNDFLWRSIVIYVMIAIGLLAMLFGVFLSLCHSMKSKLYQRRHVEQMQIFTVHRPSAFPPSYEECQRSQEYPVSTPQVVVPTDGIYIPMSLAPPLYSQNNSEIPDSSWCWEQPPPYSQAVQMQQGQRQQEEAASAH